MVTWADVRRWQPGPLQGAVGPLNGAYNKIIAHSDDLRGINTPDGWTGDAASAAATAVNTIIDGLEEYSAEIAALRRGMGDTGDAIIGIQQGVHEAEELARVHNFSIGDDGAIIDHGPPPGTPVEQKDAVAAERRTIAAELRERVTQVLRSATDLDNDFSAVLDRILSEHTIDATANDNQATSLAAAGNAGWVHGSLSIPAPPPADATVAANAGWWSTLSPAQRATLIADHPELVGNRDGVAGKDRSAANLLLVGKERTRLLAERDRLLRDDPDSTELSQVNAKLASLDAVDGMMHDDSGNVRVDRQLLSLDMTGERAKAAVASGNVDTAKHVAIFTPGMNSTVDGRLEGYVNDMEEVRWESSRMVKDPTGSSVATVTWLGYEPPNTSFPEVTEAISENRAREGAVKLEQFSQGIEAARTIGPEPQPADADPHLTLLGHSYGSTTTGLALSGNTGADDAVLFGSPGISWQATLDGMNTPGGHVYNLDNDDDMIADLGLDVHGEDPSDEPQIKQMSTHDAVDERGLPLAASHGHSGYLVADGQRATSEYNMAAVVAGQPELVIPR